MPSGPGRSSCRLRASEQARQTLLSVLAAPTTNPRQIRNIVESAHRNTGTKANEVDTWIAQWLEARAAKPEADDPDEAALESYLVRTLISDTFVRNSDARKTRLRENAAVLAFLKSRWRSPRVGTRHAVNDGIAWLDPGFPGEREVLTEIAQGSCRDPSLVREGDLWLQQSPSARTSPDVADPACTAKYWLSQPRWSP